MFLQVILDVLDVDRQGLELVDLHEGAGDHALLRRGPVADDDAVAGEFGFGAALVVERAADGGLQAGPAHAQGRGRAAVGGAGGLHEREVDDALAPAVLDVADAADQRFLGQARAPVVGRRHELLDDLRRADLEEVDRARREAQSPDVRAQLGVSRGRKGAGDGLTEQEFAQRFRVLHPVAAADHAACDLLVLRFQAHGFRVHVELKQSHPAFLDDRETLVPVPIFGFLVHGFEVMFVFQDPLFRPRRSGKLEALILEERGFTEALLESRSSGSFLSDDSLTEGICESNGLLVVPLRETRRKGGHGH